MNTQASIQLFLFFTAIGAIALFSAILAATLKVTISHKGLKYIPILLVKITVVLILAIPISLMRFWEKEKSEWAKD